METPVINKKYVLQKFPGKGGWTYAVIDGIPQDKKAPFGMVQVKGHIDHYEIKNYNLMPMGNGKLFLPVKADIRKVIRKKEGDWVNVVLYTDDSRVEIPEELLLCLMDEPATHQAFLKYSQGEQRMYIGWINAAKRLETKANRIAKTMDKVSKGLKFADKEEEI